MQRISSEQLLSQRCLLYPHEMKANDSETEEGGFQWTRQMASAVRKAPFLAFAGVLKSSFTHERLWRSPERVKKGSWCQPEITSSKAWLTAHWESAALQMFLTACVIARTFVKVKTATTNPVTTMLCEPKQFAANKCCLSFAAAVVCLSWLHHTRGNAQFSLNLLALFPNWNSWLKFKTGLHSSKYDEQTDFTTEIDRQEPRA